MIEKKNIKNIHNRDFSENQWIVNKYSYFSSQDTEGSSNF